MSKSNLVAFQVPADLQDAFNQAVAGSGGDKSSWLVDAIRNKLNLPVADLISVCWCWWNEWKQLGINSSLITAALPR